MVKTMIRALRYALFLPVQEAEDRERAVTSATQELSCAVNNLAFASNRVRDRSSNLRSVLDDVLGRLDD